MNKNLHDCIDHTNYSVSCTEKDIKKLCREATRHKFRAVCVNLIWVELCSNIFKNEKKSIKVSAIIDFPLGANGLENKILQAKLAKKLGATEIDTVMNLSNILEKKYDLVEEEIIKINSILPTKFIIEHSVLTDKQVLKVAELLYKNKAFCLKLATGFIVSEHDQKLKHIKLIKKNFPELIGKASGGIKSNKDCQELLEAGASIIGSSKAVKIISETSY